MKPQWLGPGVSRVDGRAKVTGAAKYSAEYPAMNLAYGWVVSSAICRGSIQHIDVKPALAVPGVLHVFTHENVSGLPWFDRTYQDEIAPSGSPFRPLYKNEIQFSGQPVALVVAESLELARHASTLVRVAYKASAHDTELTWTAKAHEPEQGKSGYMAPPSPRGDVDNAFAGAEVRIETEYFHGDEHHNPMEMFGATVIYHDDGRLTVYDKTQGVTNVRNYVSSVFKLDSDQVRVLSPFVGGGFGSGLRPQYELFLAVLAALQLKRSVRVTLTRQQMFTLGYRPATLQKFRLGASRDGTLQAFEHVAVSVTSRYEDYAENLVNWGTELYNCANTRLVYKVAPLDLQTPIDMRAPGAATGVFGIESAMDELAYALSIDPIQLRLINYTEQDPEKHRPFSSKELRECYRRGAEAIGWSRRNPQPRSMRNPDGKLVGLGMASGIWTSEQVKSSAKAVFTADGKLRVSSAASDIGTGTYTIMTQVAAETLGIPLEATTFLLGDSSFPEGTTEGGSRTAASVGSAVLKVCEGVRDELLSLARRMKNSPLHGASAKDVLFTEGQMSLAGDPSRTLALADVMKASEVASIEKESTSTPDYLKQSLYTRRIHSAVFAEVHVDEELGVIWVAKVVNAVAGGRVLNAKTARSQVLGGVVFGIGMALEEDSILDNRFGRFINHNYAEYHVPVNADVPDIEVIFVEETDDSVNPLGVKGFGEIGVVATAAAIGNAVYHATGKRVRDLPITPDKLL